jgi:RNA polymerase sigma-70 factor, ECF subfamily
MFFRSTGWRAQLFGDQELWKKIAKGDDEAFDAWYRETAPRLRIFLRHLLHSEQVVEDIMQETYSQIWRHPYRFRSERGSSRAYLFGVARRQAAEWHRNETLTEGLELDPPTPSRVEGASMLAEVFNLLPLDQRTLFWLREVEWQSYEELATILEIPIGTVRSRLFASREALRKIWKQDPIKEGGR